MVVFAVPFHHEDHHRCTRPVCRSKGLARTAWPDGRPTLTIEESDGGVRLSVPTQRMSVVERDGVSVLQPEHELPPLTAEAVREVLESLRR